MDLRSSDMTLTIDPGDSGTQKKARLKELKANGKCFWFTVLALEPGIT
jgi:hypothetical protein